MSCVENNDKQSSDLLANVSSSKNYLSVKVNIRNAPILAMLDTGASVSILSSEFFQELGMDFADLQPVSLVLKSVKGDNIDIFGKIELDMQMEDKVFRTEFIVANIHFSEHMYQALLGLNFMTKYDVCLKVKKKILKTKLGKIDLFSPRDKYDQARVILSKTVTIPAQSEMFVEGTLNRELTGEECLLEPSDYIKHRGLLVAKSVVRPEKQTVCLSVLNLCKKGIKLTQDTIVASVHVVSSIIAPTNSTEHVGEKTSGNEFPDHLKGLLDGCPTDLTSENKQKLKDLIVEFQDIFSSPEGPLGRTQLVEHEINTGNQKPVKIPPRRLPWSQKEIIDNEIDTMLEQNIIEPSSGPWSSPVLLVVKKDGSPRFCIDFRKLNTLVEKDAYPLPRIDDIIDTLAGQQWFCTLDLASGYWQIPIAKKDKVKTAFSSHRGLFHFNVMPFGLSNAPATFERLMETVLKNLQWKKCLCYLDDVIVFGTDFEITLSNLREVFLRFREANLKLKPSKCKLFQKEVQYLGHIVSAQGVQTDPSKTIDVENWPVPGTRKEVRSFLGFVGYYRRFVPDFSEKAHALVNLTRKKVPFVWDESCQKSFETLKNALLTTPILCYPNQTGKFILDTDASGFGMGAVLSQIQEGEEKVIAYASRTFNKAQRQYCTTKRELLAVVTFLRHFRHYLLGRKFLLRSDHAPLLWLKRFKEPEGMMARWLSIIDSYDFEMQYRPGNKHLNADGLSRIVPRRCKNESCIDCAEKDLECIDAESEVGDEHFDLNLIFHKGPDCNQSDADQDVAVIGPVQVDDESISLVPNWLDSWSREELQDLQESDIVISPIMELLKNSPLKPPKSQIQGFHPDSRILWCQWNSLVVDNGLLYRILKNPVRLSGEQKQLVAPRILQEKIFDQLHKERSSGHFGIERTTDLIKRRFYWPGIDKCIKRWCAQCDLCARCKPGPGIGKSPLQQFTASAPLQVVAIDILGPLPVTEKNNEYIIVIGDYFTKWKEAYAVPNHTAQTVADKLVIEVFTKLGCPEQIHTDQGPEFQSNLFKLVCEKFGIEKTRTNPYRPQSDGLVERFNRTLIQMLSIFAKDNQKNWDDHLPYLLMAYRATEHKSTHCSPNLLMLGREIKCPIDLMVGNPPNDIEHQCPVQYVEWVKYAMGNAFQFAYDNLGVAAQRQKDYHDKTLNVRKYKIGSKVWRWYPPTASQKLGLGWTGPFEITAKINDVTYTLSKEGRRSFNAHVDHLKPYLGATEPNENREQNAGDADGAAVPIEVEPQVTTRTGRIVKPRDILDL